MTDRTGPASQSTSIGTNAVAQAVVALIALVVALHLAAAIFAPVAFAFFIVALVWPLQRRLQRVMPKLVALLLSMIVTLSIFFVFGYLVAWGFGRVGRSLLGETARFQALYDQAALWLEGHGIVVVGIFGENLNVGWLLRTASRGHRPAQHHGQLLDRRLRLRAARADGGRRDGA